MFIERYQYLIHLDLYVIRWIHFYFDKVYKNNIEYDVLIIVRISYVKTISYVMFDLVYVIKSDNVPRATLSEEIVFWIFFQTNLNYVRVKQIVPIFIINPILWDLSSKA